ncbi:MAG: hypothetical protein WBQ08_11820 [Candidatus Sulfotelmatobacter sp.]
MFRFLRHALRQLRESPGFALTATLTLALGIGASRAIFTVLDAVLLEPLPFAQPDRLVAVASQPDGVVSIPTMLDYQSRSTTFSSLAAYRDWSPTQKATNAIAAHRILVVTQGFFSTLGTTARMLPRWLYCWRLPCCSLGRHCSQSPCRHAGPLVKIRLKPCAENEPAVGLRLNLVEKTFRGRKTASCGALTTRTACAKMIVHYPIAQCLGGLLYN